MRRTSRPPLLFKYPTARAAVLGYDRSAAWTELARRAAGARGQTNATFLTHNSSPAANGGRARLPAADAPFNLLICGVTYR